VGTAGPDDARFESKACRRDRRLWSGSQWSGSRKLDSSGDGPPAGQGRTRIAETVQDVVVDLQAAGVKGTPSLAKLESMVKPIESILHFVAFSLVCRVHTHPTIGGANERMGRAEGAAPPTRRVHL
jgi:hypothetical protein